MSITPGSSSLPNFFKVSIPSFSIPGCNEADDLVGDFLLPLVEEKESQSIWKLEFNDLCGYTEISLVLNTAVKGQRLLEVRLSGATESHLWKLSKVKELSALLSARLIQADTKSTPPSSITVSAVYTSLSTAVLESASLLSSTICNCFVCNVPQYKVVMKGQTNRTCGSCESISTMIVSADGTCEWRGDFFTLCDSSVQPYLQIGHNSSTCETWMNFRLDFLVNPTYYSSPDVDCLGNNTLGVTPGGTFPICNWGGSYVIVEPILDFDAAEFDEADCFNRNPCPEAKVSIPHPDRGCQMLNLDCGCGCSCSNGGCASPTYDMQAGQMTLQMGTPDAGPLALVGGVTLLTSPYYATASSLSGRGTRSFINQVLSEIDEFTASVSHCDGSIVRYKCKDSMTGAYVPVGGAGYLRQLPDGSWIEIYKGIFFYYDNNGILTSAKDQCGLTWTFNSSSPLSYIQDPFNRRTTYLYDGAGNLSGIEDPFGRLTQFQVDANGNLVKYVTPELCTLELKYDSNNRLNSTVAPEGDRTTISYNSDNWVKSIERPNGGVTTYLYINYGTTKVIDPKGNVTTLLFDGYRNNTGEINPLGQRTTWSYTKGFVKNQITPGGIRTTYTYTSGADDTIITNAEIRPTGRTTYVYDSESRLEAIVDALGYRTTNIFTTATSNQLRATVNPLGDRTTYTYDANGWLTSVKNPLGNRTTYVYDSVGQRIATVNPNLARTSVTYQDGQPVTDENALGNVTTTLYDSVNRVIAVINPLGERTSTLYDANGRTMASISPTGARTSIIYGVGSQRAATIDPLGYRTSYTYDINGNQIRIEDALGNITTTVYNVLNQGVATIDPLGNRSTVVYNSDGQKLVSINPYLDRYTSIYDIAGRGVANINPIGARNTSIYNANNQTIATVDPLGNRSTTIYDCDSPGLADS